MVAVIPLVGVLYASERGTPGTGERPSWISMIPLFIVGFALMSAFRTVGDLGDRAFGLLAPAEWSRIVEWIQAAAERCLVIAMAAVGLTSFFAGIRRIGLRPFLLGLVAAVLVGGVSLTLIVLFAEKLIDRVGL